MGELYTIGNIFLGKGAIAVTAIDINETPAPRAFGSLH